MDVHEIGYETCNLGSAENGFEKKITKKYSRIDYLSKVKQSTKMD